MTDSARFLIGYGERLTEQVAPPSGGGPSLHPYDFTTARARLSPMIAQVVETANDLPELARPGDRVVTALTLHPSYVAKSYYPSTLLRSVGFEHIGSRPVAVTPELVARKNPESKKVERFPGDEARSTTQLFVASTRSQLQLWSQRLASDRSLTKADEEIIKLENFELPAPRQRLKLFGELSDRVPLEVVLHAAGPEGDPSILTAFQNFAESIGATPQLNRRADVGSLSFVPVEVDQDRLEELAKFAFLRVARVVPRLRPLSPYVGTFRASRAETAMLPKGQPLDPDVKIAVFDGGFPTGSKIAPWVSSYDPPDIGSAIPEYEDHGHAVTSAVLFGNIDQGNIVNQPVGHVDHFRVLDANGRGDDYELFDVIQRIKLVLEGRRYEFINLSIGPDLAIEDDEVHAWTAFFDSYLSDGRALLTAAVGNNGELDRESGNARVQVPADSVNALAVGATDSRSSTWKRAEYSAVGPGRSPGLVKPDLVAFGGSLREPFIVVDPDGSLSQVSGTSFAAPLTLRTAASIRALFGQRLDPISLRALLIHAAETQAATETPCLEVGWGRVPQDLERIVLCQDGMARVIYQGELESGKYLRARIPFPPELRDGKVTISATLVFSTGIDEADPSNYTRSGVDVVFRPNDERFTKPTSTSAKSSPFFSEVRFPSEYERRSDGKKWETVIHDSKTMVAKSLLRPAFDIHYNAREDGHGVRDRLKLQYAMVITIRSKRMPDLYDRILQTYATQLEAIVPKISVPVRLPPV